MRIAYKNEIVIKIVYFFILAITSVFLFFYSGSVVFLILLLPAAVIYFMIAFRKEWRRMMSVRSGLPEEWRAVISGYSFFYHSLDEKGRDVFEKDIMIFLSSHRIRGIRGVEAGLKTRLLVAAGVATILHGRRDWEPPFSDGVIIYPGETFDREYSVHRGNIAGMAGERKPLLLTEDILEQSFSDTDDGYNSLIHEIAHYFDFENPLVSGVPLIGGGREKTGKWVRIIRKEMALAGDGRSFLRPYAGMNESEFFAVASEFFFERPGVMKKRNRELYEILMEFYNLDTHKIIKK